MDVQNELQELRKEIDALDSQLVALFQRRMEISERVAAVKREGGLQIVDAGREQRVLENAMAAVSDGFQTDVKDFMQALMTLSKRRQSAFVNASETKEQTL